MTRELTGKLAMRFMIPDSFRGKDITVEIIDDSDNYLPLDEVFIGFTTKQMLKKLFNDGDIDKLQHDNVLRASVAFYRESLRYVLTKMDMNNTFWLHAVWVDFFRRDQAKWSDIEYFIERFGGILQYDEYEIERMYEEFVDYKSLTISELPDDALTDAVIQENEHTDEYRIDVIWYYMYQMKSPVGNNYRFRLLFNVARLVLVTPHSNAGIERVYALVNKNKAEGSDRNRLDIERSLSSILAAKLDQPEAFFKCYDFKPDAKLLAEAKKATTKYNNLHSVTKP